MKIPAVNRLAAAGLALAFAAATGTAQAQTYYDADRYDGTRYGAAGYGGVAPDRYGSAAGAVYDYARVLRVDPVIASGYGYGQGDANCRYTRSTYAGGGYRDDDYRYGNDPYRDDRYGSYGYGDRYGYGNDPYRQGGTQAGSNVATVIGGLVGAAIGSQVGGGSARYATAAIGSMVGGMAGREIYERGQRERYDARTGTVRVCDPAPYGSQRVSDGRVSGYDVTYEYAGREFRTRTDYHPGDRIRVRVQVQPD